MPIKVFLNDISLVKADAIVNSANTEPIIGGGAEAAIYEAADGLVIRHKSFLLR